MTNGQQQNVSMIIKGYYAKSSEDQQSQWREIASRVYANALRDPEVSLLALHTQFSSLQKVAVSADFVKNAKAVVGSVMQPFKGDAKEVAKDFLFSSVATLMKLKDDPLLNVKTAWQSLQATRDASVRLAEHATGILSFSERQALAALYDLPYERRIEALHGVTLKDTATMVSVGSLPGIFPNAIAKSRVVLNDAASAMTHEINALSVRATSSTMPALVVSEIAETDTLPNLPHINMMASKNPDAGGVATNAQKPFDIKDYEFPDNDYDHERNWYKVYYDNHVGNITEHMKEIGLKSEIVQLKEQLNYMLDIRVTTNPLEYVIARNNALNIIEAAVDLDVKAALNNGLSAEDANKSAGMLTREFERTELYVKYEREKRAADLAIDQKRYEIQERARLDPDSVGFDRSASPRRTTERELHHHLYLQDLREKIIAFKEKLELLGLTEQAGNLQVQMHELLKVSLQDSKSVHQQRMADFMKIEEEANKAQYTENRSTPDFYISEKQFKSLQNEIGADLAHLGKEIEQDREYHIRHQLFQRQRLDEQRASDSAMIEEARVDLLGEGQPEKSASDPGIEL